MTLSIDQTTSEATVATSPKSSVKPVTAKAGSQARAGKRSKKDQLAAMISKPDGVRITILVERLGWQPHTVRAALSGLRKQGHQILASKSPKTGEAVYRLMTPMQTSVTAPEEVAS